MSLAVEKLDGSMAKLTITVPAEEFTKAITSAYNKQKSKFSVPGFRKGKVPQAFIEKMYGAAIFYEDAANQLINEYYPKELENCEEEITSNPEIDVTQIEKGKDFIFTATVAVKPEIKIGDYKGVEIEKIDTTVTDEDVMAEILKDQKENGRKIDVTDRAAQMDDEVTINFEGFVDDVAFEGGKGENYKLTLGSHSFIDTFEDQIVGKNIGDKFDVNVTFPEEYHVDDLKGKPAVFKVELLAISALELPELDDEFASDVSSFETFAEYKEDKKKTLEVKKEEQAKREKQSKVVEKIAEAAEVEIPEAMIKYNQERIVNEMSQRMMYQGLQMEQYLQLMGTTKEEFLERVKPDAIARIKTSLVLEAVAAAENIVASDDDVDAEIQDMAAQYQMKPEELKDMIGAPELENIKKDIASRKALEFLGENCKEV
ncbi:trigger factor [Eubacterium sp. MSJ-33]|uniref:trigger factor n=1 Tax=Eubacterium sp. MSJ-33 TaxID=2841528 RepID=UPI001C74F125|nr:trigger factor [Eubacterium sp. MSJ-33]QWT53858.1 trigger factor [Eubacterium sp. MSJ-33]